MLVLPEQPELFPLRDCVNDSVWFSDKNPLLSWIYYLMHYLFFGLIKAEGLEILVASSFSITSFVDWGIHHIQTIIFYYWRLNIHSILIPDLLLFLLVSVHCYSYLIFWRKCSQPCKQAKEGTRTGSSYIRGDRYLTCHVTICMSLALTCPSWPRQPHVFGCPGLSEAGSYPHSVCLTRTLVYLDHWYVNWFLSA